MLVAELNFLSLGTVSKIIGIDIGSNSIHSGDTWATDGTESNSCTGGAKGAEGAWVIVSSIRDLGTEDIGIFDSGTIFEHILFIHCSPERQSVFLLQPVPRRPTHVYPLPHCVD
jgi:hypothetical protein